MFTWTKNLKQWNKGVNQSKIFLMLTTQISLKLCFWLCLKNNPQKLHLWCSINHLFSTVPFSGLLGGSPTSISLSLLLCHTNPVQVLLHYIHKSSLRFSSCLAGPSSPSFLSICPDHLGLASLALTPNLSTWAVYLMYCSFWSLPIKSF